MDTQTPTTKLQAAAALHRLRGFIGPSQLHAIDAGAWGEERQYFFDKVAELARIVAAMPRLYQQDGKGGAAVVHLHYFIGSCDWWITEIDAQDDHTEAFGLADLGQGFPELGYIDVREIAQCGAEIDMHWTPKPLAEIQAYKDSMAA